MKIIRKIAATRHSVNPQPMKNIFHITVGKTHVSETQTCQEEPFTAASVFLCFLAYSKSLENHQLWKCFKQRTALHKWIFFVDSTSFGNDLRWVFSYKLFRMSKNIYLYPFSKRPRIKKKSKHLKH